MKEIENKRSSYHRIDHKSSAFGNPRSLWTNKRIHTHTQITEFEYNLILGWSCSSSWLLVFLYMRETWSVPPPPQPNRPDGIQCIRSSRQNVGASGLGSKHGKICRLLVACPWCFFRRSFGSLLSFVPFSISWAALRAGAFAVAAHYRPIAVYHGKVCAIIAFLFLGVSVDDKISMR